MKKRLFILFYFAILILFLILLVYAPQTYASAVTDSLALAIEKVVPTLFPFLVLSCLLATSGLAQKATSLFSPFFRLLFKVDGVGCVPFLLGILGGYPVGASAVVDLYQTNQCTKEDAEHILSFCNNTGPGFIIATVGLGMFGSATVGIGLYLIHVLSAVLVGFLISLPRKKILQPLQMKYQAEPLSKQFVNAVKTSAMSAVFIVGFIVVFSVILKPFELVPMPLRVVINGVLELTNGISFVAKQITSTPLALILTSAFLGFGGLSVHCQTLMLLSDANLSAKKYFLGKLLHGVFSAILTFLFLIL